MLPGQFIDVAEADASYYGIASFPNLDKAIDAYLSKGFIANGRRDLKPWKIDLPIDWLKDPYKDGNWLFQLQAWRMLDPFLRRFNSGDVNYISNVINDWVGYEIADSRSRSKLWYDMSTGLRALKISYVLIRCVFENRDHSIENLDRLIVQHLRHLANKDELGRGNHALFQLNGLMALVWTIESKLQLQLEVDLASAKEYAVTEMEMLLTRQLGAQGVHTENSPDYHFFALKVITDLLASPWWKEANLEKFKRLLVKSSAAKYWLVTPALECVPVGDSTRSIKLVDSSGIYEWPHLSNQREMAARLDGYAVVRTKPEIGLNKSSFLFFQASFYSVVHKHSDCLSFVWQEKGKYVLIDSGKYGYQSDRFRTYFLSSLAHNTITMDGVSTSRAGRDACYGSGLEGDPILFSGYWVLSGFVNNTARAYRHRRVLVYRPGEVLYVVDCIANDHKSLDTRKVQLAWHFDPRFVIHLDGSKITAIDRQGEDKVSMSTESTEDDFSVEIFSGKDTGSELLGWVSNAYLKYEPTASVVISGKVEKENIFVTKFDIGQSEISPLGAESAGDRAMTEQTTMQPGHENMEDDRREQVERSEVFLDVDEGALVARIEVQPSSVVGAEYAFYLQQDGKRVETRWYSSEPHARFATPPEAARYRAIGFVRRMGQADTQMVTSASLQRGTSRAADWTVQRGDLSDISEMLPATPAPARLDVSVPGSSFEYQCLLIRKRGNRLYVIFGGAVPERSKAVLPRFSRFTWAPDFPGPVLCIADPTLLLGPQLRLGWYFGRADADATTGLAQVVEAFAKALGLGRSQIVTYGSSGGGFAAMQVAARIGEGATSIAINAQTNALDFAKEETVAEFLSVCTGGMEKEAAQAHFGDRLSLVKAWQTPSSARARCLLLQNRRDHHHHDDHCLPFAAALGLPVPGTSTDGRMSIMLYDFPNGHGAEPRSMLPAILKRMRKLRVPT